jgi:hypothetical protein
MADRVPPPAPSRQVPAPPLEEPLTDPSLHAALSRHDNKNTWRSIIIAGGALVTGVATFFVFIDARIAHATDAGVAVLKAEQKGIDARVTTMEKRVDRIDDKLDLLLDAARVPQWKRPPPLDGGAQ